MRKEWDQLCVQHQKRGKAALRKAPKSFTMGPPAGQGWSAKHQGEARTSLRMWELVQESSGRRSGQVGFALGSVECAAASGEPLGVRQRC